jgi:uncharacterized membrane protein
MYFFGQINPLKMTKFIPTRLAEVFFALVMMAFGALHFKNANLAEMHKSLPSWMPGDPSTLIYISGVAFLLAGLAILVNKFKRTACYMLALMLIIFIVVVHLEKAIKNYDLYQPLKDAAIAMAAIIIGNNSKH